MPDWKAALAPQLERLKLSPAREREILEELSQHLDEVYRERCAAGVSHEAAMRAGLEELEEFDDGHARPLLAERLQVLQQASARERPAPGAPGDRWVPDVTRDVAYAARTLLHGGAWVAIVVMLLALGIGASTALFSATDALLFAPLPVDDPDGLVRLRWVGRNDVVREQEEYGFNRLGPDGQRVRSSFSYPVFRELGAHGSSTVELFASAPHSGASLVIDGQAELGSAFGATGNYFAVLGVRARLGRVFTPDDDRATSTPVGVISWPYWRARFGGDPAAIGKVIQANGIPLTIIGVLPPYFRGVQQALDDPPDIYVPLSLDAQMRVRTGRSDTSPLTAPTVWWVQVMGRLRPGATPAGVARTLEGVFQRSARAGLDQYLGSLTEEDRRAPTNRDLGDIPRLLVDSARRGLYDASEDVIASATILNAVVAIVLLIVCANVANLMLSRVVVRRREVAIRLALGATRTRLIRQLLTEALLLAFLGAALGMLVAWWGVHLLPEPASNAGVFHWRTFIFAAAATIATTLLFGVVPALKATDLKINAGLLESGRRLVGRRTVLGRALIVIQVALSIVLLVSAGLFLQTLSHLRRVDPGFDTRNLLLVSVMPQASGYDMPRAVELYRTLLERLAAIPGVRGVALSQPALLSGSISSTDIYVAGQPLAADPRDRQGHEINRLVVSPAFFQVIGIPIVRGRGLTARDDAAAPRVAVINETAAKSYLPGDDPIGKRFGTRPDRTNDIEIVGIARDAKYSDLREPVPPTLYVNYLQAPRAGVVFQLRTSAGSEALAARVREVVRQVDPNLPLASVLTQEERIEQRIAQERLFARACSLFGAIALVLASIGLFGLMSYSVARRTTEMGVRMALGAQRRTVVWMIMAESLRLVGIGLLGGLTLAGVAGRLISAQLFGVQPYDPGTIAAAAVLMTVVAASAAYLPARRASLIDPMEALRSE